MSGFSDPEYDGKYTDRTVKYGDLVRNFDKRATADDMQVCADAKRAAYQHRNTPEWEKPRQIAEAAYCQSLADRKRT